MENTLLRTALHTAERNARSSKLKRLMRSPLSYTCLMGFNKVLYPIFRRGVYVHAKPFFGGVMRTLLPSGTDIVLNGIKSHDSEIRLTKFLTATLGEGDTFIDVGAHYGYYALLAGVLVGEKGRVFAVEASGNSFALLKENAAAHSQIQIYLNAAGDTPGEVVFYEYPGPLAEYNTVVEGAYTNASWIKNVKQTIHRVQTIILDELIETNHISKAVIKIDVEGGELAVLRGLQKAMQQIDLTIVIEYLLSKDSDSLHHQAMNLLLGNGFKLHVIDVEGNAQPVNDVDQYLDEAGLDSDNLVFVKSSV